MNCFGNKKVNIIKNEIFDLMDTNGDDKLSKEELGIVARHIWQADIQSAQNYVTQLQTRDPVDHLHLLLSTKKQFYGFINREIFNTNMEWAGLLLAAYDSITNTLQNNLDNKRYNADQRKDFIMNQIDNLKDISDSHNQHIVDMVSYLDMIRSKIKEIFDYYQQSIQTFLLIHCWD